MASRLSVLCIVIAGLTSCSWFDFSRSKVTVDEVQNPIVSLFDGNLDAWVNVGAPGGWQVADGILRNEGGKNGNWLRSKKEYTDFALYLDYKASPGGNSGVFLRCAEQGNPWETGYECKISCEQPPADEMHCTGSLFGYVKANPRPEETPDVWHSYEILCKGKRIMVLVDGHKTIDVNQDDVEALHDKPLQGYIGLQDSQAGGSSIEYRNIRIRELH
jgi:hypothetical protein